MYRAAKEMGMVIAEVLAIVVVCVLICCFVISCRVAARVERWRSLAY